MKGTPYYDPKNPKCDKEQLAMLERCSEDRDIFEWNKWRNPNYSREGDIRITHEDEDDGSLYYDYDYYRYYYDCESGSDEDGLNKEEIWLQNVNFNGFILSGGSEANELQTLNLKFAHLEGSTLNCVPLSRAKMDEAYLQYSDFFKANLSNASFCSANLQHADLTEAFLTNARFTGANLEGATLRDAFLEGTKIYGAHLEGADFSGVTVNKKTIIKNCYIDEKTDFTMVDLDSALIEPSLLAALKTNIRRMSWKKYFKNRSKSFLGMISTIPMRLFWWLSDYGSSSVRIGLSILIATLFFTDVYLALAKFAPGAFTLPDNQTLLIGSPFHDYIRVLCFAISTMVTLGFGGINIKIVSGHNWLSTSAFGFVTLNLITGYLFLSVLVTRFGILFQSQAREQISKKQENHILYLIIVVLLTLGIDVATFNNGIIDSFITNLILVIINPVAIYSFIYLFLLSIKTIFLFFKKNKFFYKKRKQCRAKII